MVFEPPPIEPQPTEPPPPPPDPDRHPIRIISSGEVERSRLTVFFRLLLGIPHFIWIFLWSIAALIVAILNWLATLFAGRSPEGLHNFLSAYVRYSIHLYSYIYLAANPYPGFVGTPGSYPVDAEIDPPERQNRWKVAFRLILALPTFLIAGVLAGSFAGGGGGGGGGGANDDFGARDIVTFAGPGGGLVAAMTAILAWFSILALGRLSTGFRDLLTPLLRYTAQANAYFFLLTDRYPNSDIYFPPAAPPEKPLAVKMTLDEDLSRSRLTVFFRLLLALPHLVWLFLWAIVVWLAVIVNWFAALIIGRSPAPLHRFISAFVCYEAHVFAFLFLAANPFPGFVGAPGYALDIEIDEERGQSRWITLFRIFLLVPSYLLLYVLSFALYVAAILGWFASLALGRMPNGLRSLAAYVIHYQAQFYAYAYVLTDRYPYSGPVLGTEPRALPEPEPEPEQAPTFA